MSQLTSGELRSLLEDTTIGCNYKISNLTLIQTPDVNYFEFQPLLNNQALQKDQMENFAKRLQVDLKSGFNNYQLRVRVESKSAPLTDSEFFTPDNNFIYKIIIQVL